MNIRNVKSISTKGLTKCLISKFSILNGAKCIFSEISWNYLVFIPTKNALDILLVQLGLIRGNLMECQKKIFKK